MEYAAKNTLKPSSIIDRMHEQEVLVAECVSALENVVAKITGSYPTPTADNTPQNATEMKSLYGKLKDHEEFLRTVISRLTAAASSLDAGL